MDKWWPNRIKENEVCFFVSSTMLDFIKLHYAEKYNVSNSLPVLFQLRTSQSRVLYRILEWINQQLLSREDLQGQAEEGWCKCARQGRSQPAPACSSLLPSPPPFLPQQPAPPGRPPGCGPPRCQKPLWHRQEPSTNPSSLDSGSHLLSLEYVADFPSNLSCLLKAAG